MGFVGNYAPCGLSPQTDSMPVIHKTAAEKSTAVEKNYLTLETCIQKMLFYFSPALLFAMIRCSSCMKFCTSANWRYTEAKRT